MKKLFVISIIFLISLGCSSKEVEEVTLEKITPNMSQFSIEDLVSVGFKKNKTYKVDKLPNALGAYFGFVKVNEPSRDKKTKKAIEYEVRIYDSHDNAINYGLEFAKERVGPNAKLKKDEATWKEGLVYARLCLGDAFNTWKNSADCGQPKFNEFYVYGNLIILCEGRTRDESINNCNLLLSRLE